MQVSYKLTEKQKLIVLLIGHEKAVTADDLRVLLRQLPEARTKLTLSLTDDVYAYVRKLLFEVDEAEQEVRSLRQRIPRDKLAPHEAFTIPNIHISTSSYLYPYHKDELATELERLEFLGLLSSKAEEENSPETALVLTEYGQQVYTRLRKGRRWDLRLRAPPTARESCFIAMAIGHTETDELFTRVFEPACMEIKCKAIRIDATEPETTISDAILQSIVHAVAVVADLTFARPSVYFEAGFAHGLGIPLLLTCRKDHYRGADDTARVHFDLEQYKISFWERTPKGQFQWENKMSPHARLRSLLTKSYQ